MNIVAKSEINLLAQLAQVDKRFVEEERNLIFQVGHHHNLTDEEIGRVIDNPEPVGTLGALTPRQKLNYLLDCIDLIFIDHQVLESELSFCRGIAMKMGLRMSVIDFLINNRHLTNGELQERVYSEYSA